MGFLDKAKQMAEQAQQKIDDAQRQFNEKQASSGGQATGGVRYDEHGRPVAETPAAADPAVDEGVARPQPPEGVDAPPVEEPSTDSPPPPTSSSGANTNPDPFKPIG